MKRTNESTNADFNASLSLPRPKGMTQEQLSAMTRDERIAAAKAEFERRIQVRRDRLSRPIAPQISKEDKTLTTKQMAYPKPNEGETRNAYLNRIKPKREQYPNASQDGWEEIEAGFINRIVPMMFQRFPDSPTSQATTEVSLGQKTSTDATSSLGL